MGEEQRSADYIKEGTCLLRCWTLMRRGREKVSEYIKEGSRLFRPRPLFCSWLQTGRAGVTHSLALWTSPQKQAVCVRHGRQCAPAATTLYLVPLP